MSGLIPVSCAPSVPGAAGAPVSDIIACGAFDPAAGTGNGPMPIATSLPGSPPSNTPAPPSVPAPTQAPQDSGPFTGGLPAAPTGSDFRLSPFVVSGPDGGINVPVQTEIKTDGLFTSILSGVTGTPGSFAAVTTKDPSGSAIIVPIWFPTNGPAIEILPPSGDFDIIAPPSDNFPTLVIGTDGQPRPVGNPKPGPGPGPGPPGGDDDNGINGSNGDSGGTTGPPANNPDPNSSGGSSTGGGGGGGGGGANGDPEPSSQSSSTTSSTTTSAETTSATPFLIIPSNGTSSSAQKSINDTLNSIAGSNSVARIDDGKGNILIWKTSLNSTGLENVKNQDSVSKVVADNPVPFSSDVFGLPNEDPTNITSPPKVRRDFAWQMNAFDELATLSQTPLDIQNSVFYADYKYDFTAGQGSFVFIIDSGINEAHAEFKEWNQQGWYDFIDPTLDRNEGFGDPTGHGSCLWSQIASPYTGAAKKANIVNVKVPSSFNNQGGISYDNAFDLVRSIGLVADYIERNDLQGRSVVLTAWSFAQSAFPDQTYDIFFEQFSRLELLDALVVVPVGNLPTVPTGRIETYPATWNLAPRVFGNHLVVGSTDTKTFEISSFTAGLRDTPENGPSVYNDPIVDVWAPGEVNCIGKDGPLSSLINRGTSFAAGYTAGLAAYLLQAPNAPLGAAALRQRVIDLAHQRVQSGLKIIYNGIGQEATGCTDESHLNQALPVPDAFHMRKAKRDGLPACSFLPTDVSPTPTSFLTVTGGLRGVDPTATGQGPSLEAKISALTAKPPPTTTQPVISIPPNTQGSPPTTCKPLVETSGQPFQFPDPACEAHDITLNIPLPSGLH